MDNKCLGEHGVVVIGGGVAGVTCVEQLSLLCPAERVILITASPLVKAVTNVRRLTRALEEFNVEEKTLQEFMDTHQQITVVNDAVVKLDAKQHTLWTQKGDTFTYKKLCICTGARPKIILENNPFILGIRDTETVEEFQKKLQNSRRIVLVGNGGIATELAYEVKGCEVIWAIKDVSIGSMYFDAGAAEFFLQQLSSDKKSEVQETKKLKYTLDDHNKMAEGKDAIFGSALGPDWAQKFEIKGPLNISHNVHIEYGCEVASVLSSEEYASNNETEEIQVPQASARDGFWPVYVKLTNGKCYGCDFVVSATGVVPNVNPFLAGNQIDIEKDGGMKVNDQMQTSVENIYAAGDVCTAGWKWRTWWFQMRLWTQARQMGAYAASCIASHLNNEQALLDFCFEIFTHVTRFFGFKVVLLGLYNGQSLESNYEALLRITKGTEYVKVVLKDGKVHGAILVGDTDLEETFENLILNQIDVSIYGEDLLNPNIDIEDYFD